MLGQLVDVTGLAREKRFIVPVALTGALYEDVRDLGSEYLLSGDTAESRLSSLLHYARANVFANQDSTGFEFTFYMPVRDSTMYTAVLSLMPGDEPDEPVITIMKPWQV